MALCGLRRGHQIKIGASGFLILRRLPDIELDGPVERLRSDFINGIKRMPVRFTPERGRQAARLTAA